MKYFLALAFSVFLWSSAYGQVSPGGLPYFTNTTPSTGNLNTIVDYINNFLGYSGSLLVQNGGTGGTPNNIVTNIANANASLLPNWKLALNKVRDNTGNAHILFIGDSTTRGTGSTGTNQQCTTSLTARVAQFLNSPTGSTSQPINPALCSLAIPSAASNAASNDDTRWSGGTGWLLNSKVVEESF